MQTFNVLLDKFFEKSRFADRWRPYDGHLVSLSFMSLQKPLTTMDDKTHS